MIELRREPPDGPAARALWEEYMALTRERLGDDFQPTEAIFATPEALDVWLVLYEDGEPVGCGGLRGEEIKRMFVREDARGRGHGRRLLAALEEAARAAGHERVRLYTTEVLFEARTLYESAGYEPGRSPVVDGRQDFWLQKELSG